VSSRLEQIRLAHASARPTRENPAWVHTHNDLTIVLAEVDRLSHALQFIADQTLCPDAFPEAHGDTLQAKSATLIAMGALRGGAMYQRAALPKIITAETILEAALARMRQLFDPALAAPAPEGVEEGALLAALVEFYEKQKYPEFASPK
jgi:hypothetical protein